MEFLWLIDFHLNFSSFFLCLIICFVSIKYGGTKKNCLVSFVLLAGVKSSGQDPGIGVPGIDLRVVEKHRVCVLLFACVKSEKAFLAVGR